MRFGTPHIVICPLANQPLISGVALCHNKVGGPSGRWDFRCQVIGGIRVTFSLQIPWSVVSSLFTLHCVCSQHKFVEIQQVIEEGIHGRLPHWPRTIYLGDLSASVYSDITGYLVVTTISLLKHVTYHTSDPWEIRKTKRCALHVVIFTFPRLHRSEYVL